MRRNDRCLVDIGVTMRVKELSKTNKYSNKWITKNIKEVEYPTQTIRLYFTYVQLSKPIGDIQKHCYENLIQQNPLRFNKMIDDVKKNYISKYGIQIENKDIEIGYDITKLYEVS